MLFMEAINGNSQAIQINYIKNLIEHSENVDVSLDAKKLFFRCKLNFFEISTNWKLWIFG